MSDREKVIEILEKAKTIIECWVPMFEQYNTPAGIDYAVALLKTQEPVEPRLLAAEEVQHLPDKTVICVEQLLSREDEERGYITGKAWGIVCNRGGLILSMLGTFFADTVREIPYKATYRDENAKRRHTAVYRFWTDRPTNEQSKAVKWE